MTAEEATKNMRIWASALRKQEIHNLMAITGCDREQAEKLHAWISDGAPERMQRAGARLGEQLARAFRPLASIADRYRT